MKEYEPATTCLDAALAEIVALRELLEMERQRRAWLEKKYDEWRNRAMRSK